MTCSCPNPTRPVDASAIPAISASLAGVGGVYEFVAAAVTHGGGHGQEARA